ncbi:MAG: hypothetical protein ACRD5Z_20130, partial [Bryobacteraceae bacterium]
IYQMGLCFEELKLPDRAKEAYKFITDESKKGKNSTPSESLTQVVKMATWRNGQLAWQQQTEERLQELLGGPDLPEATQVSATPKVGESLK